MEMTTMSTDYRDARANGATWGLVLSAGDGRRLKSYVRELRGLDLPKQYVNFIGQHSMLEHTFRRAEKLISKRQIVTVISKDHLRFAEVRRQLADRANENVIVQPANKETGPGIFLPLMHIYKRAPEAIVSVFPSDHFILEVERFIDHVDLAVKAIAHDPSRIVLLAMEAQGPEVEYGYIVPHTDDGALNLWGTRNAANFVEKPDLVQARELVRAGGLWNTMIMVFKVRTVLKMMQRLFPTTYLHFARIFEAIGTLEEKQAIESVYQTLEPMNFSKGFLEKIAAIDPKAISVLPVLQVFWSDLGSPERLTEVLELLGRRQTTPKPAPTKHNPPRFDPWIAHSELAR
jgi:mannose-1-phosphate guanylyltransferase